MNQLHRAGRTAASPGTRTAASLINFFEAVSSCSSGRERRRDAGAEFGTQHGKWSLLRSVKEEGPQTVAEIARASGRAARSAADGRSLEREG